MTADRPGRGLGLRPQPTRERFSGRARFGLSEVVEQIGPRFGTISATGSSGKSPEAMGHSPWIVNADQ